MEKFHYFLYGNKFTLRTDQKPLVSIYWKHLLGVSPRIKRLIVRALPYNFHVVYVPGKLIPMADALSRNFEIHFQRRGRRPDFFTNSCSQLYYWKLSTASRQICNGSGRKHPKIPHYNCWQNTSQMVSLQIKRNLQRNCTLTGIIEMNFLWRMESCWSHTEFLYHTPCTWKF